MSKITSEGAHMKDTKERGRWQSARAERCGCSRSHRTLSDLAHRSPSRTAGMQGSHSCTLDGKHRQVDEPARCSHLARSLTSHSYCGEPTEKSA